MTRKGVSLWPEYNIDADAISDLPFGTTICVTVNTPRNAKLLRKYWAMLRAVNKATEVAPNVTALSNIIKEDCGLVDKVILPDGRKRLVSASIALDAMGEDDFQSYFKQVERWIAENLGIDVAELRGMQDAKNG